MTNMLKVIFGMIVLLNRWRI